MKKGDSLKATSVAVIACAVLAIYLSTQSEPPRTSPPQEKTRSPMTVQQTPDGPLTLTYSTVYEEVSAKKRKRPRLNCRAAVVVDNHNGEILFAKAEREPRPIASLTKLMTAMVYLDCGPDLTQLLLITPEDAANSAKSYLRRGESFLAIDLLHAALMSSDNRAARALSRAVGMTQEEFVARMNRKADSLGLTDTHFEEVTGLSGNNVSTAYDCALLLNAALEYDLIREITTTPRHAFYSVNRNRRHHAVNSNRLVFSRHKIAGGKTGYILDSGWCLATRAIDGQDRDITTIILGAPSNGQRFSAADRALRWGYNNAS